ncbi:unnamed protein product [Rhizophagus irregularis]|nr:unnamed protein product [Rhizophagus irregularis]
MCILAINFKPPIVETRRQQEEALTLPREIFEIIDSSIFWDHITLINNILEPYCKLLNVLQCDKARLFQFFKVLQMSKLRADITYGYRLHNNPILIEPTLDIDDANETDTNQNPGNLNGLENNRSNDLAVNLETNFKPIEVDYDSDDKAFEPQLENAFGEYLQGWMEMLKEEENAEIDEVDEKSNTSLDDITHPANDTSAKWELITLFNNNIDIYKFTILDFLGVCDSEVLSHRIINNRINIIIKLRIFIFIDLIFCLTNYPINYNQIQKQLY